MHQALIWASGAGKDSFLIVPAEERSTWIFARLDANERLSEGDAVEAAMKSNRVVWVGDSAVGNDFTGFLASVENRVEGPGDIRKLAK